MKQEEVFPNLERLYSELDQSLSSPSDSVNACGECRECCTSGGLNLHNVTSVELDYIAARVGEERITAFQSFSRREATGEVCPYFDEEKWGCGIYEHRPFSCRTFGHLRTQESELPKVCIFRGQEKIFAQKDYFQEIPLAIKLKELNRAHWPYKMSRSESPSAAGKSPGLPVPHADDLDAALDLQAQGRLTEAIELLSQSDIEDTPYFLYVVSLILEGLGIHGEACRAASEGLLLAPDCADLHFRRCCSLFHLGDFEAAAESCRRTLAISPDHSQALALLGGYLLQQGKTEEARGYLSKAAELDPKNESVRRLLDSSGS